MRIFVTGATGFIGSRVVPQLLAAGHQVLGMTRSDRGAAWLASVGAEAHHATLEDLDSLRAGAAKADAIIHAAFDHDFSNFVANCEKDRRVITALGEVLKGSNRPLLITSGVGLGLAHGSTLATEDVQNFEHGNPRVTSELAGKALLDAGVNVSVMRLPQVHDTEKQGLITPYIDISRAKGLVAYVGEGTNAWSSGHVDDVALLYRLAIERAEAGARYNAVAEEGVSVRDIATVVSEGLGLPLKALQGDEVQAHFGWLGMFAGLDLRASSEITRKTLGWNPQGPGLIEDLRNMDYTATAA
ncbi:SDR family oxidoreductase [Luteibacter yeojuensis]|uniref:NAD-dependent dehydratase n=1 Tax=Luteibacter yeojuensis TaxID=345309 RepID=A0A0F3KYL4_9GAMM|nr:SDR family oxidoreductase [Luteibacter yeojuensis]KJV35199.1 NAD-dependent dehydratase [Luteibacter yeojuensis]